MFLKTGRLRDLEKKTFSLNYDKRGKNCLEKSSQCLALCVYHMLYWGSQLILKCSNFQKQEFWNAMRKHTMLVHCALLVWCDLQKFISGWLDEVSLFLFKPVIIYTNLVILFVLFRIFLLVDGVWKDQLMVNHRSFISSLRNMFWKLDLMSQWVKTSC